MKMTPEEVLQYQIEALDEVLEGTGEDLAWSLDNGAQIGYVEGCWLHSVPYIGGVACSITRVDPSDIPAIIENGLSDREHISVRDWKEVIEMFATDWDLYFYDKDEDEESMYEKDWRAWKSSDWY